MVKESPVALSLVSGANPTEQGLKQLVPAPGAGKTLESQELIQQNKD